MGRWAQRRRGATDKTKPSLSFASIVSVVRVAPGHNEVDVTFNVAVTSVDAGFGDMQMENLLEDASIESQQSTFVVRYGSYDTIGLPETWLLVDDGGLHFAGGLSYGGPLSGSVS